MNILCDLDAVVADFWGPVLEITNREHWTRLRIEDILDWDMKLPGGRIWDRPGFFEVLPPLHGAKEGLQRLLEQGHEVFLVSAGHGLALAEKSSWVRRVLPFMRDRAVFTDGKTPKGLVRGDALIDDGPHNVVGFKKLNPQATSVLCEYPYATEEARKAADFVVSFERPGVAWGHLVEYFRNRRTR